MQFFDAQASEGAGMFSNVERRRFLCGMALATMPLVGGRALAKNAADNGFRDEVMDLMRKNYPGKAVEPGADPMSIKIGNVQVTLDNLHMHVMGMTGRAREDAILEFVASSLKTDAVKPPSATFATMKSKLRIQVAPAEFAGGATHILNRAFSKGVIETVVVDQDTRYEYVSDDEIKKWRVPAATIFQRGIDNLDIASIKVHVDVFAGAAADDRCAIVNLHDGYCAARVLCPKFMASLHEKLAEKIYVTVPARDFLLAWTGGFSKASLLIQQAGQIYEQMDHPLTRDIFVSEHGQIRLASADEIQAMNHA